SIDNQFCGLCAGGWNKRILVWNDSNGGVKQGVERKMSDVPYDILCMVFCPPRSIAVGLDDGSLFIFDYLTGEPRVKNIYKGSPVIQDSTGISRRIVRSISRNSSSFSE